MASATILIVDDDPDFVEIMRTILTTRDYAVITAANGTQAMQQVTAAKPDLLILDIMMSTVLDGYMLSEKLAADPELRYLPIIMVSSIAETPHAGLFPLEDRLHMDAWVSKPVNPSELLRTVDELLKS